MVLLALVAGAGLRSACAEDIFPSPAFLSDAEAVPAASSPGSPSSPDRDAWPSSSARKALEDRDAADTAKAPSPRYGAGKGSPDGDDEWGEAKKTALEKGGPEAGGEDTTATDQGGSSTDTLPNTKENPQTTPTTSTINNPSLAPWWGRVPPIQKLPPSGLFVYMPDTPGYYSLKDFLFGPYRQKPPLHPHPRFGIIANSFFDQDFRYLDDVNNRDRSIWDSFKRIHLGDNFLLATGGEFRSRYNNEVDSRLSGTNNVYELTRTRVFADIWYRDRLRIYAEYIDAQTFNQDLPPLLSDHNHGDFLNLFTDIHLFEFRDQPVYFRAGRQELLYGSQRLISPLDWVNTRRTFQGGKFFWQNQKWSADLFCVQPVIPSPNTFDPGNNYELFSGLWVTYRPKKGRLLDLYYLNLNNEAHFVNGASGIAAYNPGLVTINGVQPHYNVSTLGSRWYGDTGAWLWDVEGMFQFGPFANQQTLAKAYTTGGGYRFKDVALTPQIWIYYDYASGDPNPGTGNVHRTFNQLFPFGHPYFGFIDAVGRQNINDINGQISFFPTRWICTLVQYHVLRLDSPRDALYNAGGTPIRRDPTGAAGSNVGDELDFLINFRIAQEQNVLLSYSHLYVGDFIRRTGSPRSPDYLYLQYTFRF